MSPLAADGARLARARGALTARVLLFGSWARRVAAPRSDLDLAIDAGERIRPEVLQRLAFDCEALRTLRKIDLVDLHAADPPLRGAILREGTEPCAHFEHFQHAVKRLAALLAEPESMTQREALIHCFEFAFELDWKAIQARLRVEGIDAATPRLCLEQAWRVGWADDESEWLDLLRDRNLTSHTYKESLALEVVERLPAHLGHLQQLAARLER